MLRSILRDMEANPNASTLFCEADFRVSTFLNVMEINRIKNWDVYL